MSSVEVPVEQEQEAVLKKVRQFLLGLIFTCAKQLVSNSPGKEFQVEDRRYYLGYSYEPYGVLSHPDINYNEIRGDVTLPSGSKRAVPWPKIIPARPTIDGRDLFIFFLRKGENLQGEESREWFDGSCLDGEGQYRTMSLDVLKVLANDLMHILPSLPAKEITQP